MRMLENLHPLPGPQEPGFVFVVHGQPQSYVDLEIVAWALSAALHQTEYSSQNQDISEVVEACFSLPYSQGAGFVEVWLHDGPPNTDTSFDPVFLAYSPPEETPIATGHWLRIGYADSMSNIFTSRIYDAGDNTYILEDY